MRWKALRFKSASYRCLPAIKVLESNCDAYSPGDLLFGMTGWQDYVIADEGERAMQSLPAGISPTIALGLFGITGMTAYFGMTDVGRVKEGQLGISDASKLFTAFRMVGIDAVRLLFAREMESALRDLVASGKLAEVSARSRKRKR